ncbi:MAG: hypothetical protein QOE48_4724 [Mycobacterium sp.]|nr:hypothetical protein [Mycobacterium sp.]
MPKPDEILWIEWAQPQAVLMWTDGLHGLASVEARKTNAKWKGKARRSAIARREAGEVLTDIARSYSVSHTTISPLS